MQRAKDYRRSSSGNLKIQDVLKGLKEFLVVSELNKRVGCHPSYLKSGLRNSTEKLPPDVPALEWVELIFLPPNTTSVTQPMDQGVIRGLKAKYRSLAVKKQITGLEKGSQLPKFSILTAMSMLTKAWSSIPNKTFTNCFKKSGISEVSMERALNDDDHDPFASLDVEEDVMEDFKNDLEVMKEKFNMNFELTAEELVDIDFEISVTGTVPDADINAEVTGRAHDADDEEDSDNEEQPTECLTKPYFNDEMDFITILEDYSLFSNFGDNLIKALKEVNRAIDLDRLSNKKQSNIEDFFDC